jgi:hypothetical protein
MKDDVRIGEKSSPQVFKPGCDRFQVGIGQYGYPGQCIYLRSISPGVGTPPHDFPVPAQTRLEAGLNVFKYNSHMRKYKD